MMLRRVLGVILVLGCGAVFATNGWAQNVAVGVKAGLNISDVSVDDPADPGFDLDSKTGFAGGGFLQIGIGEIFAVQPELLFSQKGAKDPESDPAGVKIRVDYIEVPVLLMARIPVGDNGTVRPNLYVAPVVSFETKCDVKGEEAGVELAVDCDSPALGDPIKTKTTDFGLMFGAGLEIGSGRFVFLVDGRYNLGLTNLNDTPGAEEISVKNRAFSVMAGVGVRLGR